MAYATQQDIIDRYGSDELTVAADHDSDGVADPAVVTQGLADASDEIDAYLAGRYSLPLAVVPAVLKRLCVDMALYLMSTPPAVTDEKRRRYEDAIKLLTLISTGKVTLGESESQVSGSSGAAYFTAKTRLFKRR